MNSMFGGIRADSDIDLKEGRGRLPTFDALGLLRMTAIPGAAGNGILVDRYIASASGNQDQHTVKGTAGTLWGISLHNIAAAMRFVKIYDVALPISSDVPKLTFALAPNGGGVARPFLFGIPFATAIGIRITTGVADNDTGTVTATDVICNFDYK